MTTNAIDKRQQFQQLESAAVEILASIHSILVSADTADDLQAAYQQANNLHQITQQALALGGQFRSQRNELAKELKAIKAAADNVWQQPKAHPIVQKIFDKVFESHIQAFWESLPYDLATMMGGNWSFMEAEDLHTAITLDTEEYDLSTPEDFGFTGGQLAAFREDLRLMVTSLFNGEYREAGEDESE